MSVTSLSLQKSHPTDAEIFLTECFSSAIIDTACTRTVCGEDWIDSYITALSKSESENMKKTEQHSNRPFKFGDGKVVHSTRKLKIPAKIGQTKCNIETEVVPPQRPVLLSKSSMKKAGTVLNMENDNSNHVQSTFTIGLYQLWALLCEHNGHWGKPLSK